MINAETRQRLRDLGWRLLPRDHVCYWMDAVMARRKSDGAICGLKLDRKLGGGFNNMLWDANARLVEFVEKHFGEVK